MKKIKQISLPDGKNVKLIRLKNLQAEIVEMAIKLDVKGIEKEAFSAAVDWLNIEVERLNET